MARLTPDNVAIAHEIIGRYPRAEVRAHPAAAPGPGAGRLRHRRRHGPHRRAGRRHPGRGARHLLVLRDVQAASRSGATWSTSAPTSPASSSAARSCSSTPRRRSASGRATPPPTACSPSRTSSASRPAPRRRACRSTTATATASPTTSSTSWSTTCAPGGSTTTSRRTARSPASASTSRPDRRAGAVAARRRPASRSWIGRRPPPAEGADGLMADHRRAEDHHRPVRLRRRAHPRPLRGAPAATRRCARRSAMAPGDGRRRGQDGQPARPRRRRLPGRREVGLLPARRVAALPRRQRRRERAGHLQGPHPHGARSAPAHRGRAARLLRRRLRPRPSSTSGARWPSPRSASPRPSTRPTPRATSAGTSSAPTSPSTSCCTGVPAPTSSARRPRSSRASRATGACPASSRRSSRRPRASTCSPRSSTTSRRCRTSRGSSPTAATRSPRWGPRSSRGTRMFAVSGHVKNARRVRGRVRRHHLPRPHLRPRLRRRHPRRPRSSRRSSPAAPRPRGSSRSTSTCPLEKGTVDKAGSMLGSGAIVVMDETTDAVQGLPAGRALLRPRVVRQVHAVPRGHQLARAASCSASSTATAGPATSTC